MKKLALTTRKFMQFFVVIYNVVFLLVITTIQLGLFVLHTTYVLCVNFPSDRFFEKLFMEILIYFRVFTRNLLRGNHRRNTFCILFNIRPGARTLVYYQTTVSSRQKQIIRLKTAKISTRKRVFALSTPDCTLIFI